MISGNQGDNVYLLGPNNLVAGNLIGTDVMGKGLFNSPFQGAGVAVYGAGNTIGGAVTAAGNLISGNNSGVFIFPTAKGNVVAGNKIGTDITGTVAIANSTGVYIEGANNNTIGGTGAGASNLISGNTGDAVDVSGGSDNLIAGNRIGTDLAGTAALANGLGVNLFSGSEGNTIGGTTQGAGNLISGSKSDGVVLQSGAGDNLIAGNLVGTDVSGTIAIANLNGLDIQTFGNTIGGTSAFAGNVISGSASASGIEIDSGAASNVVLGNQIGTDITGSLALPNRYGVTVDGVANTIGSTAAGAANLISGNQYDGIIASGANTVVEGNQIGTNASGTAALGQENGIELDGADSVLISSNLISGNSFYGILLFSSSDSNTIVANQIGVDAAGTAAIANGSVGVLIYGGSDNTIGGTTPIARNLISGNTYIGVGLGYPAHSGVVGNVVEGNYIGTDASGDAAIGNGTGVSLWVSSASNTIGGLTWMPGTGAGNLISGNAIGINDSGGGGDNLIDGNLVGTNAAGSVALGNTGDGIDLSASGDTIGGTVAGAGNVISGNTNDGVEISGGERPPT